MMAERLPLVHIGQMYFDKRNIDSSERIPEGNAGMCIGRRVDDNEIGAVLMGGLHPVDQLAFVITLKGGECGPAFVGQLRQVLIDICQGLSTVDLWFSGTEQIQVGAVQNEDVLRHGKFFVKTDRLFTLNNGICPLKRSKLSLLTSTHSVSFIRTAVRKKRISAQASQVAIKLFRFDLAQYLLGNATFFVEHHGKG